MDNLTVKFVEKRYENALFSLWKKVFSGEDAFWDAFANESFNSRQCLALFDRERPLSALYFFDCLYGGRRYAYIFALATDPAYRGRGFAGQLLQNSADLLCRQGFSGALLVPAEEKLFDFYRRLGYNTVLYNDRFEATAANGFSDSFTALSAAEFSASRNAFLPEGGALHTDDLVSLFARYGKFARCGDALFAYHAEDGGIVCDELLGNRERAAELLAFLKVKTGLFKIQGNTLPYALAISFDGKGLPRYFGIDLM